jgi:hypothetical protein
MIQTQTHALLAQPVALAAGQGFFRLPALLLAALLFWALAGCASMSSALFHLPAAATATSSAAGLTVREYPLVEQSKDNPTHLGFQDHVQRAVRSQPAWIAAGESDLLANPNSALAPFGFRLESAAEPPFSGYALSYQDTLLRADIARIWPVTVKLGPQGTAQDFLLPFETLAGEKLYASAAGVQPWPGQDGDSTAPVYFGEQIAYAETSGGLVSVYAGPSLLYAMPEQDAAPAPAGSEGSLHAWESGASHWALELDGQVILDGRDLNAAHQYEQVFDFRVLDGEPLYFYVKDGLTHMHYAGGSLPYVYDQVIFHPSGPLQAFNPGSAGSLVWFYALRDGLWYYVEAGRPN